jgi:hypothetical protein
MSDIHLQDRQMNHLKPLYKGISKWCFLSVQIFSSVRSQLSESPPKCNMNFLAVIVEMVICLPNLSRQALPKNPHVDEREHISCPQPWRPWPFPFDRRDLPVHVNE